MRAPVWLALLALPAAAALLPAQPTAAATSACQRMRGADLAPARAVKLVKRRNDWGGTHLLGCVLPRGRVVRIAGSSKLGTTVRAYKIKQVAHASVLLAKSSSSRDASTKSVVVAHLSSGRSYEIAYSCSRGEGNDCGRGGRSSFALAAFVNARGQAAAALFFGGSQTVTIAGYSATGVRRDFATATPEEIPPASLRLSAGMVRWTEAGRPVTAGLPR